MNELNIIFIVDGGQKMGMGHVQQATTFAKALQEYAHISFLTTSDEVVVKTINGAGFEVGKLQADGGVFNYLKATSPDIVIFDKINVDENLARDIRSSLAIKLVIFTNLTDANKYAHIAVLPRAADLEVDAVDRFKNLSYVDKSTYTNYFYGPKYWVLRPEFHEYHRRYKHAPKNTQRILLAFGGGDVANFSSQVLVKLLEIERGFSIDVILGSHFEHILSVQSVLERHKDKSASVTLHQSVKNVAELMFNVDLSITAAGMTMFESLCVGTPVIVIPQDKLQRETYKGVMRMLEIDNLASLENIIDSADFSFPSEKNIFEMEIGTGVGDLVDSILGQDR